MHPKLVAGLVRVAAHPPQTAASRSTGSGSRDEWRLSLLAGFFGILTLGVLDAQADLALLRPEPLDDRFDLLADGDGFLQLDGLVGDLHRRQEGFDTLGDFDEGTERRQLGDPALDGR